MQEQDRPKELPIQFPKILKEVVEKLKEDLIRGGDLANKLVDDMDKEDPFLAVAVLAGIKEDDVGILMGADFVYACFKELEKMGVILPKVSIETINTFFSETSSAEQALEIFRRKDLTPEEKLEEFKKFKSSVEFNFPSPFDYCEENPALMIEIAGWEYHSPSVAQGAMIVYELKRRQFFADQLKKQFGE